MNVRTVILIFVAFVGIGFNTAMSADTISVTNPADLFVSEGTCSCQASWDCFSRIHECSQEEAYKNAVQLCPEGSGVMQRGLFEHEDCSFNLIVCDIARAKFRCGWEW